jgi:peptidyl-prolyl cis-trans isomerase A (cyclophilin A)
MTLFEQRETTNNESKVKTHQVTRTMAAAASSAIRPRPPRGDRQGDPPSSMEQQQQHVVGRVVHQQQPKGAGRRRLRRSCNCRPSSSVVGGAPASTTAAAVKGAAAAALLLALVLLGVLGKVFDSGSSSSSAATPTNEGNRGAGAAARVVVAKSATLKTTARGGAGAVVRGTAKDPAKAGASSAAPLLACPYTSIRDLTELERRPKATGTRHIVDPPRRALLPTAVNRHGEQQEQEEEEESDAGGTAATTEGSSSSNDKITLVCCRTTKGPWSIAVHEAWAPVGSRRFLDMVKSNYFQGTTSDVEEQDRGVPLMRCVRKFLCQFGLAGKRSEQFQKSLLDDPQWLPSGPAHRINEFGVKRFAKGYLSYAGGGPNSRDNQLFVALADNGPLGGGSPWEVPWGELVGNHSYGTLDRIYTGYGEDGPSQHLLWQDRSLPTVRNEFPMLDWILSCHVVDETIVDD